jgi:hypothetical protein
LVEFRSALTDPEHRFFLALLLNVPTSADIRTLVSQRFPGPPADKILQWAEELTATSEIGTWLLDAEFPEDLEVADEKQAEVFLAALRFFLQSGEAADGFVSPTMTAVDINRLREAFARSSLKALVTVEQS